MLTWDGPLIVQADATVLLDERHPAAPEAREQLSRFADLVKRPGDLHTYRVTPLSVWNAASSGMSADEMTDCLLTFSRYDVPGDLLDRIQHWMSRYGRARLMPWSGGIALVTDDPSMTGELAGLPLGAAVDDPSLGESKAWRVDATQRGELKRELIRRGIPVLDMAGYNRGELLSIALRDKTRSGKPFAPRDYQQQAAELFYRDGTAHGGSGVLVMPCGAGKTIVGLCALAKLNCAALILTSNVTSVKQWKQELLDKTTLTEADVGEYAGLERDVKPVTIATYQIMTHRSAKSDAYGHMRLFRERDWGLIIYDEVHLLPAPVFRMTADIQATRRLGLTATLVREDGREEDVFSLIGPKRFDLPWRTLEAQGWIAAVTCAEIRVPMAGGAAERYAAAGEREKGRIAAENAAKAEIVDELLRLHRGRQVLVIGQYLKQLRRLSSLFEAPLLTGETPHDERQRLFERFKSGELRLLVVSKVANFAVDLPDAAVAIQVSGSFGSRQEEAQRIGRILRPKQGDNAAWFYTVVSEGTKETEYARKRQLFLTEQGYDYQLIVRGCRRADGKEAAAE